MKSKRLLHTLSIFVACTIIAGCGTTGIRVPVMHPSEVNTSKFKKVVVTEILGTSEVASDGLAFEAELTQSLLETGKFQVIDKRAAHKILNDNNMGSIDLRASAREAGRVIEDAMMVSGTITRYDFEESSSKGEPYKDKDGNSHVEHRRKGRFIITVTFQMTDMQTGSVIGVKTIDKSSEASTTRVDGTPDRISRGDLIQKCRKEILAEFVKKVVPYQEYVTVALYSDDSMPGLTLGNNKAKNGFWDQASEDYKKAIAENAGNENLHKAYYSLGLACMYTNRFPEAEENFMKALSVEPDDYYYKNALERCKKMAVEYKQLQEQTAD